MGEEEGDYYPLTKNSPSPYPPQNPLTKSKKSVRLKTKRNSALRKKTSKKKKIKKL